MSPDQLAHLTDEERRAWEACEAATPGPWAWFGNTKMHEVYLATVRGGRQFVMRFARWGMRGAQPWFQRGGVMENVEAFVRYEVPYRKDVADIDHPDARFLALSRTALPAALEALADARRDLADSADYDAMVDESLEACRILGIDTSGDYDYLATLRQVVRERDEARAELAALTATPGGEPAPRGAGAPDAATGGALGVGSAYATEPTEEGDE